MVFYDAVNTVDGRRTYCQKSQPQYYVMHGNPVVFIASLPMTPGGASNDCGPKLPQNMGKVLSTRLADTTQERSTKKE